MTINFERVGPINLTGTEDENRVPTPSTANFLYRDVPKFGSGGNKHEEMNKNAQDDYSMSHFKHNAQLADLNSITVNNLDKTQTGRSISIGKHLSGGSKTYSNIYTQQMLAQSKLAA